MKRILPLVVHLTLAACAEAPATESEQSAPATTAATSLPDLARCDAEHKEAEDYTFGNEAISVPVDFSPILAASAVEFAVLTQDGDTICHSLAWILQFDSIEWLLDDRLLGIEHAGYESYGYFLVDRAGTGSITETGARPVFSPDGTRLASLQLSESGWGGMEGFSVWELTDKGLPPLTRQVAEQSNEWMPPAPLSSFAFDWRLDGWHGNDCIAMSSIPWATEPPYQPLDERKEYFASAENDWQVSSGTCP